MVRSFGSRSVSLPLVEQLESRLLLDVSGVWTELGFRGASGGGISYDVTENINPEMAIGSNGSQIVMWQNGTGGTYSFSRYNGMNWEPLGPAGTSDLSVGVDGHGASMAMDDHTGRPYVAWVSGVAETDQTDIYLKYWDGKAWQELGGSATGGGISNDGVISEEVSLAVGEDGLPVVAYRGYDESSNDFDIIVKKWTGTSWQELIDPSGHPFPKTVGGLGTVYGGGVSNDVFNSFNPSLAIGPDNAPVVAWSSRAFGQAAEIYVRRWNGTDWETLGDSATEPGEPLSGGVSGDPGESVLPEVLVGRDPNGSVNTQVLVAWRNYPDALTLNSCSVYLRKFDPVSNTWVAYSAGSDTGAGLLGTAANVVDLQLAMGVDGMPLMTYTKPFPNATDTYRGFVKIARNVNGVTEWVDLPDNTPGTEEEINPNVQEVRFPWVAEKPDGTVVVAYTNLLSGVITDVDQTTDILRAAPYDPYHMPLGQTTGTAPIDSEILVQYWDGTQWTAYGQGAGDLGGVEDSMGQPGIAYNSPPQAAVDPSGATLMAYMTRVSDPSNRYVGHLEPRIIRYNEGTSQWESFPKNGNMPNLGTLDAPLSPTSAAWPYVELDNLTWYGDMLLISSGVQGVGAASGPPVVAFVDAQNMADASVLGKATIRVFVYNDNGTPNDESDDSWQPLEKGAAGVDKYAYVAPGLYTAGYQVDQVDVVQWTQGQVALFWRQTNPAGIVTGLSKLTHTGNTVTAGAGATGSSDIYGYLWNPTSSTWGVFPTYAANLTAAFKDTSVVPNVAYYGGLNFSPSAVVTATGSLALTFAAGKVTQAPSGMVDGTGADVLLPFIQNSVELWTYDAVNGWKPLSTPKSLAPTNATDSYWDPSIGIGLNSAPLLAWSSQTQVAKSFDPAASNTLPFNLPVPAVGGSFKVFVSGVWTISGSDILSSQWLTGGGGSGPVTNVSNTGGAVLPDVFGNGSQFPVISWTEAQFDSAGYPFYAVLTMDATVDATSGAISWTYKSTAGAIPLGPTIGVTLAAPELRPYSSFDDRQYYANRKEIFETTDPTGATAPVVWHYAQLATVPGTEHIYARRWNPNLAVWEQMISVDASGNPVAYSAQGDGISGIWGPGIMASVSVHTTGSGTQLASQPVVVWSDLYDDRIYARGWVQEGQIPRLQVLENSGALANDDVLDFGNLYMTQTGTQRFTLTNTGAAALSIASIQTDLSSDFTITDVSGNPLSFPLTIPRYGSLGLVVHANPSELGPFLHSMTIRSNDPLDTEHTMSLQGLRYSHAQIQLEEHIGADNDLVIPFNMIPEGLTATRTFWIHNVGTDPLNITEMAIGGIQRMFVPWVRSSQYMIGQSSDLPVYGAGGDSEAGAQSFDLDADHLLHKVQLYLGKAGSPTDNVYVQVEEDDGGSPSGQAVTGGVSHVVAGEDIAGDGHNWYDFVFPDQPQLTGATRYWLVLYRDGVRDTENFVEWGLDAQGGFAGGQAASLGGGVWDAASHVSDDALFVVGTVMHSETIEASGTLAVNVDFTGSAETAEGVTAYGVIRHDDYQPRGTPATPSANPVRLVFTANKPDFQSTYSISTDGTDPSISAAAVTWTSPQGIQLQLLNYPVPSAAPVLTLSDVGASHSRTDGQYVVWQQNQSIWLYNIATKTTTDLGAMWAGEEYWPNIDHGRIVYASNESGDWDIHVYDIATQTVTSLAIPGRTDFYPDLSGDLLTWRSTPIRASGNPWDAAETALTDKVIYALDLSTIAGDGSFTPFQVSVGAAPGPRIPSVSDGRIVWTEQVGGAYQLHYNDTTLATAGVLLDQVQPISDAPSIDGTLVTWAANPQGTWSLYGYYFLPRPGESEGIANTRGRTFLLSYEARDQESPASYGRLIAYQQLDPSTGRWTVRYGALASMPNLSIRENSGAPDDNQIDLGTVYADVTMVVPITITNDGTDNAILSSIDSDDPRVSIRQTNGTPFPANYVLPLGQSVAAEVLVTPGSLLIPIDATMTVTSNDWDSPTITIHATGTMENPAELVASNPVAPPLIVAGQTSAVHADITNTGLADAGPFSCQFYLDGVAIGPKIPVAGLASGDSTTVSANLAIPLSLSGVHLLSFVADSDSGIPEVNEANNASQIAVDIKPAWDPMVVLPFTTPLSVSNGQLFTVACTLTNGGNRVAPTFEYAYYWSTTPVIDPATAVLLYSGTAPSLAPSQVFTDSRQLMLTRADIPTDGDYYLAVVINPHGTIAELNATNDVAVHKVAATQVENAPVLTRVTPLVTNEDTPLTITYNMLKTASDAADPELNDVISFRIENVPAGTGTLTQGGQPVVAGVTMLGPGQTLRWQPLPDANGTVSAFDVVATDGLMTSSPPVTVSIVTVPVDDAPTLTTIAQFPGAKSQPITLTYDMLRAASNAADIENDPLVFRIMAVLDGTLTKNGQPVVPGTTTVGPLESVVWTSSASAVRVVSAFTVTAYDGQLNSAPPVAVRISVNNPPTLSTMAQLTGAEEDTDFPIAYSTLLSKSNAVDVDGDVLSFLVDSLTSGTLTKNGDPVVPGTTTVGPGETLVWRAAQDAYGSLPAFQVKVTDGQYLSATDVQVRVAVTAVNDAPVLPATASLPGPVEDAPFGFSYAALLAASGATDVDSATIRFRVDAVNSGTLRVNGVLVTPGTTMIVPGDSISWQGAANANGAVAAFTTHAYDGLAYSANAQVVSIDVAPVNDVPTAGNLSLSGNESVAMAIILPGLDVETAYNDLTFNVPARSANGTLTQVSSGQYSYLPDLDFNGTDVFTFTVTDTGDPAGTPGNVATSTAGTVQINVGQRTFFDSKSAAHFTDSDGDAVTVTLSGSGSGRINFPSTGDVDMSGIVLSGDPAARLTIAVTSKVTGKVATTTAHYIDVTGGLGTLSAKPLDLVGVSGDGRVTLSAPQGGQTGTAAVTLGWLTDVNFTAQMPLSLTLSEWDNTDPAVETLTAPTLTTLAVAGDKARVLPGHFAPNVVLTRAGVTSATTNTLGTATIAGNLNSALWDITGAAGTITASGNVADWQLGTDDGALTKIATGLTLGTVQQASLYVDQKITSLKAVNWDSGVISAGTLATLSITGKAAVAGTATKPATPAVPGFFGADLDLSGNGATSTTPTLGTATIAGDLVAGGGTQTWDIVGKAGTITVGGNTENLDLGGAGRQLTAVTSLTLGTVVDATVTANTSIGTLKATNWAAGKITAGSIGTMKIVGKPAAQATQPPLIRGDFGADLALNRNGIAPTATFTTTLGATTIAGDLTASSWEITGDMGVLTVGFTMGQDSATNAEMLRLHATGTIAGITAGAIRHADVFAGVTTADPSARRVSASAEFTSNKAIKNVTVTGWKTSVAPLPGSLLEDSNFSAAAITAATILNVDWANLNDPQDPLSGTMFGFFAKSPKTAIGSVIAKDTVQTTSAAKNWTWKSATGATGAQGPTGSKLMINVV